MQRPSKYPFADIESKWRRVRAEARAAPPAPVDPAGKRKFYVYSTPPGAAGPTPSGDPNLWRRLTVADTVARFQKHRGQTVLLPLGLDGSSDGVLDEARRLGLTPPEVAASGREDLARLAEVLGIDAAGPPVPLDAPDTWRITQWIFLQLLAKGLVYASKRTSDACRRCHRHFRRGIHSVCPSCRGELVTTEISERRVDLSPYGDRMLGDLDGSDRRVDPTGGRSSWPPEDRSLQRELLGRCRGCEVIFPVSRSFELEYGDLEVCTTRVEALFGATFILVDPYHPVLEHALDPAYEDDLLRYRERLKKGSEPRISAVRTGGFAMHPLTLKKIPILASVLADVPFSRGAVLGIPAHDAEQFELAKRQKLPIREVIHNDSAKIDHQLRLEQPWLGDGILTNSASFSGLARKVARERIITALSRKGACRKSTRFRLSSLPVTSSSPWGAPVPIVHCSHCGEIPVPESQLPVEPPRWRREDATKTGLSAWKSFVPAACPLCGKSATRDLETLLPWLGEAWSYIRLVLPHLEGMLDGFRDRTVASDSMAATAEAPSGLPDAEGAAAGGFGGAGGEEPDAPRAPEAQEVLPEDVDIFSVGTAARDDEGIDATEDAGRGDLDGGDASETAPPSGPPEDEGREEPDRPESAPARFAPSGTAPGGGESPEGEPESIGGTETSAAERAAGAAPAVPPPVDAPPKEGPGVQPKVGESALGEPAAAQVPSDAGGVAAGPPRPEGEQAPGPPTSAEAREVGPKGRRRPQGQKVRGRVAEPAREAADLGAPLEEEEPDDGPFRLSSLRPFESPALRFLPADAAFAGPATSTKDLIALRFLAKFLHDTGHVPSHLPFQRFARVKELKILRGEPPASAPPLETPARRSLPRAPEGSAVKGPEGAQPRPADARPATPRGTALPASCVEIAERLGADALRLHILFSAPHDRPMCVDWLGVRRMQRFLDRIWTQMSLRRERGKFVSRRMLVEKHRLIYDVTRRLADWKFHTAVSALMSFVSFLEEPDTAPEDMDRNAMSTFLILLSPFAPHLARELWSLMGEAADLDTAPWPVASEELIHPPEREFLICVDGKVRDRMMQPSTLEPEKLESRALQRDRIREILATRKVRKVVVVPQRLVSIALVPQTG